MVSSSLLCQFPISVVAISTILMILPNIQAVAMNASSTGRTSASFTIAANGGNAHPLMVTIGQQPAAGKGPIVWKEMMEVE
jgi:hypothetical protein